MYELAPLISKNRALFLKSGVRKVRQKRLFWTPLKSTIKFSMPETCIWTNLVQLIFFRVKKPIENTVLINFIICTYLLFVQFRLWKNQGPCKVLNWPLNFLDLPRKFLIFLATFRDTGVLLLLFELSLYKGCTFTRTHKTEAELNKSLFFAINYHFKRCWRYTNAVPFYGEGKNLANRLVYNFVQFRPCSMRSLERTRNNFYALH